MDEITDEISTFDGSKLQNTISKAAKTVLKPTENAEEVLQTSPNSPKREPLTTRNAVKFLLEGTLKAKVCRYCLNVAEELSDLDLLMQVAHNGTLYNVTIRDMIASFHPFRVADDPNFPDKICNKCLDSTLTSYLFTQQCEQAERALRNCFEDMYEKVEKLDPIERPKKRGRQKINPNCNTLYVEHEKVIDYAEPKIHIVNTVSESLTAQPAIHEFECLKCCQLLPNLEALMNHTKVHPKSMWYNCRLCGTSFPKLYKLKKHIRTEHSEKAPLKPEEPTKFACKRCGTVSENYFTYLQHLEKHKFKMVLEHVVDRKMDQLCSICFNKGSGMVPLDKMICLHGGCPELMGDRPLQAILASALPEMNILDNYTGTKICEKCVNHAVASYVFVNQSKFVRNRLNKCVGVMLENLNNITEIKGNICIEIAQSAILNVCEALDETMLVEDEDPIDETESKVDVLEDEFRLKSEDEEEMESEIKNLKQESKDTDIKNEEDMKSKLLNGYNYKLEKSICSEFLTFKKKPKPRNAKFTCPLCHKHFISDYFLKRHILKHVPRKMECDYCNLPFASKFYLYEHKKMMHLLNTSTYLPCMICGRCYISEEKLQYHLKCHNNPICQLCDKNFISQKSYNGHMQRHMLKLGIIMKKYEQNCSFCEKGCPNDNEFSLHVNKVHLQIKLYSCDMCERQFYTEQNLRSHKRVHSIRGKEQCNFCNKVLNSRKHLVIHIRKHIGDKPFYCQICTQSFYSQSKLIRHMKLHHGCRFCCNSCNCKATFLTKKELKEHTNKAHNSFF